MKMISRPLSNVQNVKLRRIYLVVFATCLSLFLTACLYHTPNVARIVESTIAPAKSWRLPSVVSFNPPVEDFKPPVEDFKIPVESSVEPSKTEDAYDLVKALSHQGRDVKVAIINSAPSHDEVFSALIYTFGSIPGVKLDLFLHTLSYKSGDIIEEFDIGLNITHNNDPQKFMADNATAPDIVISTTCEVESKRLHQQLHGLLENNNTYLFCLIHHADQWGTNDNVANLTLIRSWMDKQRMDFVALSNHTAQYLKNNSMSSWKFSPQFMPNIRTFPPVFPVRVNTQPEALSFALQGNYEASRRDYKGLFKHLTNFHLDAKANVTLRLVGHGQHPEVPEHLREYVRFDEALNYPEFYDTLAHCFAMLPAFASDTYYDRKASSSVPASLIAGIPIVGPARLLESYTYLNEDDIWLQGENETDIDVIGRVLKLEPEAREEKKERVAAASKRLMQENIVAARAWLVEALGKLS